MTPHARRSGGLRALVAGGHTSHSGAGSDKRTIWGGMAGVRTVLYTGTLSAVRHDPVPRGFYRRLVAASEPKKVAPFGRMRKLFGDRVV